MLTLIACCYFLATKLRPWMSCAQNDSMAHRQTPLLARTWSVSHNRCTAGTWLDLGYMHVFAFTVIGQIRIIRHRCSAPTRMRNEYSAQPRLKNQKM